MKIIITGALGHIGSYLLHQLPSQFENPEIILIDDFSTQRYCSVFNLPKTASYQLIETKIQAVNFDSMILGADAVIHLAATTDAAGTADKPELVYQNNFESTKIVAEACFNHKVPLIFPSSTSVYGSQSLLVDEECLELQPQSPYAECKIKEEFFLKDLFSRGLAGVICRLGTIYGVSPGMRFHTAVNKFCWQACSGQPITVWETAIDQKRPYLALEDACEAICWIIKKNLFGGEVYNIVTGNHTVREVIKNIEKYVGKLNIKYVQHKIMNQLSYEVSAEKIKKSGFSFSGSVEEGIHNTIQLLKNIHHRGE
jgi:nucleoside-diphosphate-sugar epimerase